MHVLMSTEQVVLPTELYAILLHVIFNNVKF